MTLKLEIVLFDLLTPPQGPLGQTKNKGALACPTCVSKPLTKFGWILSSGLGGDNITDRRTDRWTDRQPDGGDNIPDAFFKKRGDNNIKGENLLDLLS